MKYNIGMRLIHNKSCIVGVVIKNFKLPGDICVEWETGQKFSYDEDYLDKNCKIILNENSNRSS